MTAETLRGRESLALLPDRTGGRVVVGSNNPEQMVPDILRESDAYYVLGIERAASTRPDGNRSIEVKVGRRGLRVVSQRIYGAAPTPIDPLSRLLPSATRPLALAVMPFANPGDGKPIVRLNVDAGAFAKPDGSPTRLELSVLAVDRTGKGVASAQQVSTVSVPAWLGIRASEVNVQTQVELEPGDYGIRVSVTDPRSGDVASVFADTTVPDFGRTPLLLSGVSVEAPIIVTPAASMNKPEPTTNRTFGHGPVRVVFRIYQGTDRTDPIVPVSLRVHILNARGMTMVDQSLPFGESAFTNRRADCVVTLPLAKLGTGEYLLKLEASTSRHTSGRALRFAVQ